MNKITVKKKLYITTPIFYPNGFLHLGHAYTLTIADVIARFKIINGIEVVLQTGSDEHGEKILKSSLANGLDVKSFVNNNVNKFKILWDKLGIIDNYYFMRTSYDSHEEKVKSIFKELFDNGDIYRGKYNGLYCISCEEYYNNKESLNNKCNSCFFDLTIISEDCYFLKVEKYRRKLIEIYKKREISVIPNSSLNELFESFLNKEMPDLCITRKKMNWGIQVPNDSDSTIYVWFDALCNYLTSVHGEQSFSHNDWEIIHIIGKDIKRFHLVYWPIILIALKKRMPDKVISHGWILSFGAKMSKSKGNSIDPVFLIDNYESDVLRSYFCSKISIYNDGDFSEEKLLDFYNGFFVKKLGNLFSRIHSMLEKYFNLEIPFEQSPFNSKNVEDLKTFFYVNFLDKEINLYRENMDSFSLTKAFENVELIISETNRIISLFSPWSLSKENDIKLLSELMVLLPNSLKIISFIIWPFSPKTSKIILSNLNFKISEINFSNLLDFSTMKGRNMKILKYHVFERKFIS